MTILGMVGDHPWHLSPGQMFKLEWGHRTTFKHVFEADGGTTHIFKLIIRLVVGLSRVGLVGSGQF